jgi:hypothetical protein
MIKQEKNYSVEMSNIIASTQSSSPCTITGNYLLPAETITQYAQQTSADMPSLLRTSTTGFDIIQNEVSESSIQDQNFNESFNNESVQDMHNNYFNNSLEKLDQKLDLLTQQQTILINQNTELLACIRKMVNSNPMSNIENQSSVNTEVIDINFKFSTDQELKDFDAKLRSEDGFMIKLV